MSKGRHELKHYINTADYYELKSRLPAVMEQDRHAGESGQYLIRSLYFDDDFDTCLREKLDGVKNRDKYRIRYYNHDPSLVIHLEKKSKRGDVCIKTSAALTPGEAQKIVDGDIEWMKNHETPLIQELYRKMAFTSLKPKTIVDYVRDPYIYPFGNVRVTLDHDIRTGLSCTDFLDPDCVTVPIPEGNAIILEVKWDDFLPEIIREIVQVRNRRVTAFSKYGACRGWGI